MLARSPLQQIALLLLCIDSVHSAGTISWASTPAISESYVLVSGGTFRLSVHDVSMCSRNLSIDLLLPKSRAKNPNPRGES